jgi:hypothetical protein
MSLRLAEGIIVAPAVSEPCPGSLGFTYLVHGLFPKKFAKLPGGCSCSKWRCAWDKPGQAPPPLFFVSIDSTRLKSLRKLFRINTYKHSL